MYGANPHPRASHVTAVVQLHRAMEEATLLLRHGCYAGAVHCLPDPDHLVAIPTVVGALASQAGPTPVVAVPLAT